MGLNRKQYLFNQIIAADPTKNTQDVFDGDLEETYHSMVNSSLLIPNQKQMLKQRFNKTSPLLWNPSVSTDVPTVATSGPGGASPLAAGNVVHPYNDGTVTLSGALLSAISAGSSTFYQNIVNAQNYNWNATPWVWEFDYYGQDIALWFRNAVANGSYFWVWVNGQPIAATPAVSTAASANNGFWYRLTWGSTAHRRIRIYVSGADYGGYSCGPTDSVVSTSKPGYSILLLGDSYVAGVGASNPVTDFAVTLGRMLDVELFSCGIGGTGYVNPGSYWTFGDPARTSPIASVKPDEVWCVGSVNDNSYTSAQVSSAATSAWAAIKAASPKSLIRVVGVEATSGSPSASNIANNTALKTAANAAGYTFMDSINEGWISGTGHVGGTTGSGNADLMIGSDGVHPSQAGHDYWARKIQSDYIQSLAN